MLLNEITAEHCRGLVLLEDFFNLQLGGELQVDENLQTGVRGLQSLKQKIRINTKVMHKNVHLLSVQFFITQVRV